MFAQYQRREARRFWLKAALTVFVLPFLFAVVLVAVVAVVHQSWWPVIPLMHYWTAYWLLVVLQFLCGVANLVWSIVMDWLD